MIPIGQCKGCRYQNPLFRSRKHPSPHIYVGSNNCPAERVRPPSAPRRYGTHGTQHILGASEVGLAVVVGEGGEGPVSGGDFWLFESARATNNR